MKHHRTTAAVLLAAAVITAATGCGTTTDAGTKPAATPSKQTDPFTGLTAAQIELEARTATAAASSLRMNGTIYADGQSIDVNLALDTKGNCVGKLAPGELGTLDIIKNGPTVYLQGDERFWRNSLASAKRNSMPRAQSDALIAKFQGKWIKATPAMAKAMGTNVCDLSRLTDILDGDGGLNPDVKRGADITENGQPVAVVYEREAGSDEVTTIHVAKKGKPYPLRVITTGGIDDGDLYFSDFDQPVDATPPRPGQLLDPTKTAGV
ncbi:hypothetical protein [Streptomyces sp. NPDC093111]|uniref:hypothetical protein n=1 Tax=Streptomyces sp. NPDC093111 TaxID=3154978 RepID=UPI00343A4C8F